MTNRICGSCRHFLKIEGSNTGHCTNPLVVSHQGGLVMYREAEIGCRRGWKQDLWEPILVQQDETDHVTHGVADQIDRGRAAAWANSGPTARVEPAGGLLSDPQSFNDDDLFDPRKTRDAREAIRRAREAKKRELHHASRLDPESQPYLSGDQASGEDTVLDVRPVPMERQRDVIVPPVSVEEIRRSVQESRSKRGEFERPPHVSFREDDDRFSERLVPAEATPAVPRIDERDTIDRVEAETAASDRPDLDDRYDERVSTDMHLAESYATESLETSAPAAPLAYDAGVEPADETGAWSDEPIEGWPEQAPWAEDEPAFNAWIEKRPKRRSWFGSLLHRNQPEPSAAVLASDPMAAWEPEQLGAESTDSEIEPWESEPHAQVTPESDYVEPLTAEAVPAAWPELEPGVLPPLPDVEHGEDLLLFEQGVDSDEEEQMAGRVPRVCATCRYFRPEGTCGNSFAFTFRRRVNEDLLSCASSIGSWWLPSDRYWESVVDFAHHGQPTPLLDRIATEPDEQGPDDEIHTP